MNIQKVTYQLLGEKLISNFDSKKYVNWAVTLLENGYDSESLIILAGLNYDTTEEREEYFWKSVDELDIIIDKSDFELIENYAEYIAYEVVNERIEPIIGLSIMQHIVRETDYSSKYVQFYELSEDLDYLTHDSRVIYSSGLSLINKNAFIKEEFRIFLELENLKIDKIIREQSLCNKCGQFEKPILKTKYQLKKPYKYQVWVCAKCGSDKIKHYSNQNVKRKIIEIHQNK